ncbi:hypothetical protein BDR26DRAFT_1008475 [Obelidium mucronatum]|nr:hypothetical protein BDR26DRAFT_1008475 [Obelidium mucronatum]
MSTTDSENHTIYEILSSTCAISIFANICLVLSVWRIKKLQQPFHRLQAYLAASEIIVAICWMTGSAISPIEPLCMSFGVVYQFAVTAVSCWTMVLSIFCYLTITYSPSVAKKYWICYHCYVWGSSLFYACILLLVQVTSKANNVLGDSTFECWISNQYPILRIALFYVLLWIHFIIILCLYGLMIRRVASVSAEACEESSSAQNHAVTTASISTTNTSNSISTTGKSQRSFVDSAFNVTAALSLAHAPPVPSLPLDRKASVQGGEPLVGMLNIGPAESKKRMLGRGGIVAIGFLLSWTPATVHRIASVWYNLEVPFWFNAMVAVSFGVSGKMEVLTSKETLGIILHILCPISIIANLSLIVSVLYSKHLQTAFQKLQTSLACCEIVVAICWITGSAVASIDHLCIFMASLYQFFATAVSSLAMVIAIFCYLTVIYSTNIAKKHYLWYHFYVWGSSILMTCFLLLLQITLKGGETIALLYAPLWIHFIAIVSLYIKMYLKVWMVTKELYDDNLVPIFKAFSGGQTTSTSTPPSSNGSSGKSSGRSEHDTPPGTGAASAMMQQTSTNIPPVPPLPLERRASLYNPPIQRERRTSVASNAGTVLSNNNGVISSKIASKKRMLGRGLIVAIGFLFSWTPATICSILAVMGKRVHHSG